MHYKLKLVAIICSLICFSLTGLWLSFSVVGAELVVSIAITRMLIKYRKKKDYREMTDKEFIKEIKKW